MDFTDKLNNWKDKIVNDPDLQKEMDKISGKADDVKDRFHKDLDFGTAGIRGEMGVGSNRMNNYTVGKTTQGLSAWLLKNYDKPSVCISFDTRNNSQAFAQTTAGVLAGNGIKVYIFPQCHPVPMLSYAVRYMKASAGVMITASHNPKEYNGYKVYNDMGNQITDEAAKGITAEISKVDPFVDVKTTSMQDAMAAGLFVTMPPEVDETYYQKVEELSLRKDLIKEKASSLKIIYTPLYGSGNVPVRRVLADQGYTDVSIVTEQEEPNGDFPTAPYPNPEIPQVYELAINMAKTIEPDLIFATDPDGDRIGVVEKDAAGDYAVLTGNQLGVLLTDYILMTKAELGILPSNAAVVSTVVSTPMTKKVTDAYNTHLELTLTGFKYIGEWIQTWTLNDEHSFQFGFEESYGYLGEEFVRDKDAVSAASLICEMALYYRGLGKNLNQAMETLYEKYGYYQEEQISITMSGSDGQSKIQELVDNIRTNYVKVLEDQEIAVFEDFGKSIRVDVPQQKTEVIKLPTSDFVKFTFTDGSWLVVRPSGTEPKVKVYYGANGDTLGKCENRMEELKALAAKITAE